MSRCRADVPEEVLGFRRRPSDAQLPTALKSGQTISVRGIAFGGDTGVACVLLSSDSGCHWKEAQLGPDHGKYCFRRWELVESLSPDAHKLMVKTVNTAGVGQPDHANWNGAGFMRNVIESVSVQAA